MMTGTRLGLIILIILASLLGSCADKTSQGPTFHEAGNPALLSDWNVVHVKNDILRLEDGVVPYDLNAPLFTDYAHKLRTVWMPEGQAAVYQDKEAFDFPVGTIISKTFYYPKPADENASDQAVLLSVDKTAERLNPNLDLDGIKLIETRILAHRADGWIALPYVWNEDQTDAVLKRTGEIKKLELVSETGITPFFYVVPNANQCVGCHGTNGTTRAILPIGPKARHLNKDFPYSDSAENQLLAWQESGLLQGLPTAGDARAHWPKNVNWNEAEARLDSRARSYLDINCSHCHNPVGPADTSGLMLTPDADGGVSLGTCKLPIAAGMGTGNRKFDIVPGDPDQSILIYRMASTNPAVMMPEVGRSLAHDEGIALISEWISQMDGSCD